MIIWETTTVVRLEELIVCLQQIRADHGNLPVFAWDDYADFPVFYLAIEEQESNVYSRSRPRRVVIVTSSSIKFEESNNDTDHA